MRVHTEGIASRLACLDASGKVTSLAQIMVFISENPSIGHLVKASGPWPNTDSVEQESSVADR